ncbi:hypothetical protein ACFFX1_55275 [Dactylosporangium sucinum]|nr:hypothetical protein [Dactylosporangium sucinum]
MTSPRLVVVATILALAGCGDGGAANTAAPGTGMAPTNSAPSAMPTPTFCPNGRLPNGNCAEGAVANPPAGAAATVSAVPLKFGTSKTVVAGSDQVKVTVFAYRQPTAKSAPKPPSPGTEWASIDAQVCPTAATGETPIVNDTPWLLVYADGTMAEPSNTGYGQFDEPGFPMADRAVPSGRCVRGWITFVAPAGKRATMVEFQWTDGTVVDWATS